MKKINFWVNKDPWNGVQPFWQWTPHILECDSKRSKKYSKFCKPRTGQYYKHCQRHIRPKAPVLEIDYRDYHMVERPDIFGGPKSLGPKIRSPRKKEGQSRFQGLGPKDHHNDYGHRSNSHLNFDLYCCSSQWNVQSHCYLEFSISNLLSSMPSSLLVELNTLKWRTLNRPEL